MLPACVPLRGEPYVSRSLAHDCVLQLLWRPATARHPEARLYVLLQGQPLLECAADSTLEPWGQHLKQVLKSSSRNAPVIPEWCLLLSVTDLLLGCSLAV